MQTAVSELTVAPCTTEAATYAVLQWHYSKVMPIGKLIRFGVWEEGQFIGAVIYGRGSNMNIGSPYGLKQTEVCELVQVAMRKHEAPVTQVVALTIKALRRDNPGLRLIVSYADSNEGHVGTIYQAGNWIYEGSVESLPLYYVGGRWIRNRQLSSLGLDKKRGCLPQKKQGPKHKYLMPLDKRMRRALLPLAKPYPKSEATP